MSKVKHGADLLQFNHPQKQVKCLEMSLSSSASNSYEVPITNISMTGTWDSHSNLQQKRKLTHYPHSDSDSDQKESFNNKGTARSSDVGDNGMKLSSDLQRKSLSQKKSNKRNTSRLKSDTRSKCKDRSGETFSSNIKRAVEKKRTKNRESRKQTAKQKASQTDVNTKNVNKSDSVTVNLPFSGRR